jgi:hypothetical protein
VTYMPTSSAAKAGGEAAKADVALVFVSTDATEGKDRDSLGLGPDQVRGLAEGRRGQW